MYIYIYIYTLRYIYIYQYCNLYVYDTDILMSHLNPHEVSIAYELGEEVEFIEDRIHRAVEQAVVPVSRKMVTVIIQLVASSLIS